MLFYCKLHLFSLARLKRQSLLSANNYYFSVFRNLPQVFPTSQGGKWHLLSISSHNSPWCLLSNPVTYFLLGSMTNIHYFYIIHLKGFRPYNFLIFFLCTANLFPLFLIFFHRFRHILGTRIHIRSKFLSYTPNNNFLPFICVIIHFYGAVQYNSSFVLHQVCEVVILHLRQSFWN